MELVKVCFFVSKDILSLRFNSVSSQGSTARELLLKLYAEMMNHKPDGSDTIGRRRGG